MDVQGTQGGVLRACSWVAAMLLAAFVLQAATGVGGDTVEGFFQDYVYSVLLLTGAGLCLWRAASRAALLRELLA